MAKGTTDDGKRRIEEIAAFLAAATASERPDVRLEVPDGADDDLAAIARAINALLDRLHGADQLAGRESAAMFGHRDLLRDVIDANPNYIFVKDGESRYLLANRATAEVFGRRADELIGLCDADLAFSADDVQRFRKVDLDVLQTGREVVTFETVTTFTGEIRHVQSIKRPIVGADGRPQYVLGVAIDITDRARLEEQIRHVQKLESLGVLAGGIAHDFNNLLTGVLGNAGLALMNIAEESPARPYIEQVQIAAQRAAELTNQMLAYSGKGTFVVRPLNVSRIVEEMAHLMERVISKKAALRYNFAAELPLVEADASQIRQVVMNLITNASDALGEARGAISISTGSMFVDRQYLRSTYLDEDLAPGHYVFLEVTDTGSGMDDATRHRIFDPFFTTKFSGRGLGLAAVLGIVRGHRGAIKVYSQVGVGTTFKVLLPASNATSEADIAPPPDSPMAGKGTVLVVDDEDTVRNVAKAALSAAGFQVLTATNGREAVDLYRIRAGEISAVLLDMTMPEMNGEETFRELRRIDPQVRVLLTSGFSELDATNRFAGKGLAGFIQKPYLPQELVAKINQTIHRH